MKKVIKYALGFTCIICIGGGSYIYFQKGEKQKAVTAPPINQIQKTFMTQLTGYQNSPTGRAWKEQDFEKLQEMFNTKQSAKKNAEFFQISINLLETKTLDVREERKEPFNKLKSKIVEFVLSKDEGVSPFAIQFALKTLSKMDSLMSEDLGKMVQAHKNAEGVFKQQLFEFLVTSPQPPTSIQKELLKMATKDNQLQTVFALLSRSDNLNFKQETTESIHKRFHQMSNVGRALSLKFFVFNRNLVKGDLTKETELVSAENDDISQDAFLNAVEQLKLASKYESKLKSIASESPFYHLKSLAQTILQSQGSRP